MNREDIICMAEESGIVSEAYDSGFMNLFTAKLEHFAALVASAEREACAEVGKYALPNHSDLGLVVEAAIRARGQA